MENKTKLNEEPLKNKYLPPEGGWGYIIALAFIIISTISLIIVQNFGFVFGSFLDSVGNQAKDTSTICSVNLAMIMFSGLPANVLLQKFTFRRVGLMGSFLYVVGTLLTIFVGTATQLVFTFGVLQGLGLGVMASSVLALLNQYFVKRRNFIMSCTHTVVSLIQCTGPALTKLSMDTFGFRGTVALVSAISLNVICTSCCLHPVKWHMRKLPITTLDMTTVETQAKGKNDTIQPEEECLFANRIKSDLASEPNASMKEIRTSTSRKLCYTVYKTLDLELFKDPFYVNLAVGVSLTMANDLLFLPFLPLLLNNAGFSTTEISILMTTHLIGSVMGKALLSLLLGIVHIKNRYLQLICAYFQTMFRLAFLISNSFEWMAVVCALSGSVRCLIQNTTPIIFAEAYPHRYITTFTLAMVVTGITTVTLGQLIGHLTILTGNKNTIFFVLITCSAFCAIDWTMELIYTRTRKERSKDINQ